MQINTTYNGTGDYNTKGKTDPSASNKEPFVEFLEKAERERESRNDSKDWRTMSEKDWDKYMKVIDREIDGIKESIKEEAEKRQEEAETESL
ncbi:MAG: hypothetical protein IJP84_03275 [Lachnospiraceae bacterium]|jgi:hypothetical protein|nr:hypothetical protein [Lachnospiraceae bacterium]